MKLNFRYLEDGDLLYIWVGGKPPVHYEDVPLHQSVEAGYDEQGRLVGYMILSFSKKPDILERLKLDLPVPQIMLAKARQKRHTAQN